MADPTAQVPTPSNFLKDAIKAVPSVKYALGVGGIAAVIAIVAGFLDLRIAIVGVPVLLLLMFLLVLFSHFAASGSGAIKWAIGVLVWFSVIFLVCGTVLFSVTFFVRQDVLHGWGLNSFYELFNLKPSETVQLRNADYYITNFEEAISGAGNPREAASALERISAFWRGKEQREALRAWRCMKTQDGSIFAKAAEYVFTQDSLRKDIDTVSRYYDSVARCTLEQRCDVKKICGYYYQNMQDFRALYGRYFQEIAVVEARDPLKYIKPLIHECYTMHGSSVLKDDVSINCAS